jgi:hypothetical protein
VLGESRYGRVEILQLRGARGARRRFTTSDHKAQSDPGALQQGLAGNGEA